MKKTTPITLLFGFLALCTWSLAGCGTPKTELGTTQVGQYSAHVFIEGDTFVAGAKSRLVLKLSPGMPTSITGWIGMASAVGSVKAVAVYDAGDGDFDDDATAPSPLLAGSLFWFEVDTDGTKVVGSIPFAK